MQLGADSEEIRVNVQSPEGRVINDLTLGEYDVAITDVPLTDTFEQSQFDEAVQLRELGIAIPDHVLIEASKLSKKQEIAQALREQNEGSDSDPAAQELAQLEIELKKAEIETKKATAQKQQADAALAIAQAQATLAEAQQLGNAEGDQQKLQLEAEKAALEAAQGERVANLNEQKLKTDIELTRRKGEEEIRLNRIKAAQESRAANEKERRDNEAAKAKLDSKSESK
jgi:hypothetical protein